MAPARVWPGFVVPSHEKGTVTDAVTEVQESHHLLDPRGTEYDFLRYSAEGVPPYLECSFVRHSRSSDLRSFSSSGLRSSARFSRSRESLERSKNSSGWLS